MSQDITTATTASATTIGIDLGDRWSEICVLDAAGECEERLRLRTEREALRAGLARHRGARAVIEAGTHSPWVSRVLTECGFETIVANPRRVRLIAARCRKAPPVRRGRPAQRLQPPPRRTKARVSDAPSSARIEGRSRAPPRRFTKPPGPSSSATPPRPPM